MPERSRQSRLRGGAGRRAGDHGFAAALSALAFGVVVVGVTAWYVRRRVVAPLRQVIGVINRLADGDLDTIPPTAKGHDEIGQLCAATAQYRETALQARDLAAQQGALVEQATAARAQAIREIGGMIEDVSEQAIETVQASTSEVAALSSALLGISIAIAASVRNAADDAGLVLLNANDLRLVRQVLHDQ